MSTEIETKMTSHAAYQYWGGDVLGTCLQINGEEGCTQLTLEEAVALCNTLGSFIRREAVRRQQLLRAEIERLKITERTVFHEVAELPEDLMAGPELAVRMVSRYCPAAPRRDWE